jgi:hypothetical protein
MAKQPPRILAGQVAAITGGARASARRPPDTSCARG